MSITAIYNYRNIFIFLSVWVINGVVYNADVAKNRHTCRVFDGFHGSLAILSERLDNSTGENAKNKWKI